MNYKFNCLHERCLRIVYNNNKSSFQELLDKDKGLTIHIKNARTLAVDIFEVSNKYSTSLMNEIFDKINNVCTFETLLNLLDEMYKVSSMVRKAMLLLVLKSGILYLVN